MTVTSLSPLIFKSTSVNDIHKSTLWEMNDKFIPEWFFANRLQVLRERVRNKAGAKAIPRILRRVMPAIIRSDPFAKFLNSQSKFKLSNVDGIFNLTTYGDFKNIFIKREYLNWTHIGRYDCADSQILNLRDAGIPHSVEGNFNCSYNNLTSLEGAPERVLGNFDCSKNNITDISDAPKFIGCGFICSHNQITSLRGAPTEIGTFLNCSFNQLESLRYAPTVHSGFVCHSNRLTTLKYAPKNVGVFMCGSNPLASLVHAPITVRGDFICDNAELVSLFGAPKEIGGSFIISNNKLTDLQHGPYKVMGTYDCSCNRLDSLLDEAPSYVGETFDCHDNPDLPADEVNAVMDRLNCKGRLEE